MISSARWQRAKIGRLPAEQIGSWKRYLRRLQHERQDYLRPRLALRWVQRGGDYSREQGRSA